MTGGGGLVAAAPVTRVRVWKGKRERVRIPLFTIDKV